MFMPHTLLTDHLHEKKYHILRKKSHNPHTLLTEILTYSSHSFRILLHFLNMPHTLLTLLKKIFTYSSHHIRRIMHFLHMPHTLLTEIFTYSSHYIRIIIHSYTCLTHLTHYSQKSLLTPVILLNNFTFPPHASHTSHNTHTTHKNLYLLQSSYYKNHAFPTHASHTTHRNLYLLQSLY